MEKQVLETVLNANNVLLHCHPHPDPDSIGAVLAFSEFLENNNIKFTAILGDSDYPSKLSALPRNNLIQRINLSQINKESFDVFVILDSSSWSQVSQKYDTAMPKSMTTIVIDHHASNTVYGDINIIDVHASSTCEMLYNLFSTWAARITPSIAMYLYVGIYGDTGGFKHPNTSFKTFKVVSELVKINPNYHQIIFELENNRSPEDLLLMGMALQSVSQHLNGKVGISYVSLSDFERMSISITKATKALVGDTLRSVINWPIVVSLVQTEPLSIMVSFRTRDESKYDMSLLAKSIGVDGGGHKGAAGTTIRNTLELAIKEIVDTIESIYGTEL